MYEGDERADVVQDHALPLPSYLSYLLYQTEQHRRAMATDLLARHGLTFAKWVAMISLRRFGNLSMTRLAKLAATDRTTLTRSIDGLIADGLVERKASSADRRIVVICLTDTGRTLLEKIRAEIRPLNRDICANLTTEEQAAMTRYLQKMLSGLIVEPDWKQDVIAFSTPAPPETA
ncbi:MarR family winged helix-turn-helix transcriptional regulator [Caulobacter sp. 602-1]|uniref:MarR family winged helix-turn-helix transcriptional regulator n=1 Tax=Caulobacter sp. 602-1 TaxID=2492472 RepID=UPI000F63B625|nr:MarR family transcriptional regulator [Caulobacter sp. 602-1]RRN63690.1 MarR family transcriptional regulator [Caulobacter sp. 602-1]